MGMVPIYRSDGAWVALLEGTGLYDPLRNPPLPRPRIRPPAKVPLAPLFAELPWDTVDVFEENPTVFRYVSELKPDWEG